jgi:hypothetical protein
MVSVEIPRCELFRGVAVVADIEGCSPSGKNSLPCIHPASCLSQQQHELRTGTVGQQELRSLPEFVLRFPKFRALLASDPEHPFVATGFGITGVNWFQYLRAGPPRGQTP